MDKSQTDVKVELPPTPPPPDTNGQKDRKASVIYRHLARSSKSETMLIISQLYSQILVVSCAVVVFTEVLNLKLPLMFFHGYMYTYLLGGAIVCLLGVYISMAVDKCPRLTGSSPFPNPNLFIDDRYDVSLYLRIGALVFGLGTLTAAFLEVAMIFTLAQPCADELYLAQPVMRGIFTFLQLHFFFLNAKEVLRSLGWFRHVALMHLLATNVAIWLRLVLWEAARDWLMSEHIHHNTTERWPPLDLNLDVHTLDEYGNHHVYRSGNCWWLHMDEEGPEEIIGLFECLQNSTIGAIWYRSLPYMYPFIIQYSLLAAAVVFVLWNNVPIRRSRRSINSVISENGDDKKGWMPFRIDCRDSSKGLFFGLLILVAGTIVLILFYVISNSHDQDLDTDTLFAIVAMHCSILGVSLVAALIGIFQVRSLPNKCRYKFDLNSILQNTTILAIYVYGICNMIIGSSNFSVLEFDFLFADGMFMVLQAFAQTLLIHQLSRKHDYLANNGHLGPYGKPSSGRQVVIFLVFGNLALWLIEAFTAQNSVASHLQNQFYGEVPWNVVTKITLPLITFYRFHSLVSFLEDWRCLEPQVENGDS